MKTTTCMGKLAVNGLGLIAPPACPGCGRPANHTGLAVLCPDCLPKKYPANFCLGCGHGLPWLPWMAQRGVTQCRACRGEQLWFDVARNLGTYRGGWKRAVLALKKSPAPLLARQLARRCLRFPAKWPWPLEQAVVTTVPNRAGGIHGTEQLARCLAGQWGAVFAKPLHFIRKTVPQHTLDRARRMRNMRGSMGIRSRQIVMGNWLVVDDVYTTGATVRECARVLKKAGARQVGVLTLARGLDRRMEDWQRTVDESFALRGLQL